MMDFTPQDFVHYLLAAAGAITLDNLGIYLVSEKDNDLIEKLWTGTEIADQVFIASEIRKNSPALYLLNEEEVSIKRFIYEISLISTSAACFLRRYQQHPSMLLVRRGR